MVVIIASSVAFLLSKMLPGDEFTYLLSNPSITAERVAQLRLQFGDNTSWLQQYFVWLASLLHGDLLWSKSQAEPVTHAIARALPNTLQLMGLAFSTSIIGGILLGTWQATKQGSVAERVASGISFTIFSLPDFWVAMLLQLIFAFSLGWLPFGGKTDFSQHLTVFESTRQQIRYTILPWLSLTLVDLAVFARYQRAAVRDVMAQQFLRTARAKGVSESDITWKHTMRVALLPMITIAGMYFPALLVGAILIETVFSWPGVGQLLIKAVEGRDYFLVSGIVVVGSAMTALGSFLADVTREFADPRLRHMTQPNSLRRTVLLLLTFLLVILAAPSVSPYNPVGGTSVSLTKFQKPSLAHPMGTDAVDRDLLSRVLWGSQKSVMIAVGAVLIGLMLGTGFGMIAALSGGWIDTVFMRATDVAMAVPRFLVLLAVTTISHNPYSLLQLTLLVGVTGWFDIARLTRGEVSGLLNRDWVMAARATGTTGLRLALKQILPHMMPMLVVVATLGIGRVVVLEAGLSYLGAGSSGQSLGSLLHDGFSALGNKWWMTTFPGLAIVLIVLACNALGDALRDVFAPEQVHAWPTT